MCVYIPVAMWGEVKLQTYSRIGHIYETSSSMKKLAHLYYTIQSIMAYIPLCTHNKSAIKIINETIIRVNDYDLLCSLSNSAVAAALMVLLPRPPGCFLLLSRLLKKLASTPLVWDGSPYNNNNNNTRVGRKCHVSVLGIIIPEIILMITTIYGI